MKPLPRGAGGIDWDSVAGDYHGLILSPLAPEMVAGAAEGLSRNLLLNDLLAPPLTRARIADFGCGPGNLLEHLAGRIDRITLVDLSPGALERASERAGSLGIAADLHLEDMRSMDLSEQFDLIVSINSVLPASREDVVRIFESVRRHLAESGMFMAILPSYDTTVYLRELTGDAEHSRRKRADNQTLAYADDGVHAQCYHTPDSIRAELASAGLEPAGEPQKVYYPWGLTRRHGYGYFPDAPEEIWDWYVRAGMLWSR